MEFHRRSGDSAWHTQARVLRLPNGAKRMEILNPEPIRDIVYFYNEEGFWATPLDREERKKLDKKKEVDTELLHRVFFQKSILNLLEPENLDLLFQNYYVGKIKEGAYIGRDAIKVKLTSHHDERPHFTLWIDKESKMQLKFQRFDRHGQFEESFAFLELDLNPRFSAQARSTEGLKQFFSKEENTEKKEITLDFTPLQPEELPEGFILKEENKWKGRHGETLHKLYWDGLTHLSLFQRRLTEKEEKEIKEEKTSPDTIKIFEKWGKKVYTRAVNGIRLSIVSDISPQEITDMLASMKSPSN
jgi:negative regulator of sigma E activity